MSIQYWSSPLRLFISLSEKTMASASTPPHVVVSPLLELLINNLNSLIRLKWGVDKKMKNLASTLSTIHHVLEDAEEKQFTNTPLTNWLLKLRDLAYEADDTLDEWVTGWSSDQVRVSCLSLTQLVFRHKVAKRLDHLGKEFDDIVLEMSGFGFGFGSVGRRLEHHCNLQAPTDDNTPAFYGRDEERELIVRLLLDNVNSQEVVSVFPIVGIAGLGKTTLAQVCYGDQRVEEHFDVRIWVHVSNDFDVKKLTTLVLTSIVGEDMCNLEELDPFQRDLHKKLAHKRFLLILDDVWNEKQQVWSRFKNSLNFGARGSSVIVTTRLNTVASITGTQAPLFLKFLSEDDCWSLFKHRAFGTGNDENSKLTTIGHEILKKCGGVPLAAKVLGGLMGFIHDAQEWLFVRDSTVWDPPPSDGNTVVAALRLSYNHLELRLRRCFAYCSVFPKNSRMEKNQLIRLWMANGFIQSVGGRQLEDVGSDFFDELSWRSFFQDEMRNSEGTVVSGMMHDVVHDLACSINAKESYNLDTQTRIVHLGTRHLSINCSTESDAIVESIHQLAPNLRTLMLLDFDCRKEPLVEICLKSLRALSLKQAEALGPVTRQLLDSVANLKHLRYLNISYSGVALLPNSLCELKNLQTLELNGCIHLEKLPKHMGNMSALRHLNMEGCDKLSEMPSRMGKLIGLQTLSIFVVGKSNGRRIKELGALDYLGGEVEIKGLGHVKTREEAKEAKLIRKQNIVSLKLVWERSGSDLEESNEADLDGNWKRKQKVVSTKPDRSTCNLEGGNEKNVLEGLQPHPNMKILYIEGYTGLTFPSWLSMPTSLPNIVFVSLFRCTKCEWLPSFGGLPLLRSLEIQYVESVKFFLQSDNAVANEFFSLKDLTLKGLRELEDWFPNAGNSEYKRELEDWFSDTGNSQELYLFPRLKTLVIESCPQLKRLPPSSLPLLETLHLIDCNPMILESLQCLPRLSSLHICFNHTTDILIPPPPPPAAITKLHPVELCGPRYQSLTNVTNVTNSAISKVKYQHLNCLRQLRITGTDDMTLLPNGLQHLSSTLEELVISNCSSLILLPDWIQSFTSLKSLQLEHCKYLRSLPNVLQQLTNLRLLNISACHPELHRRCKKETGEDWLNIAHIPKVINKNYY